MQQPDVQPEESGGGAPAWMVTYADMVTLLMTFFVLLLSFANMDITKFQDMMGSIREALGVRSDDPGQYSPRIIPKPKLILDADLEAAYAELGASFEQSLEEEGLSEEVEVVSSGEGVTLRMEGSLLYQSGSAAMGSGARGILEKLSGLLIEHYLDGMLLMIEGHSDSDDIVSNQFPSNWELSAARASGALRALLDYGVPDKRVLALGYGDTRPLAKNDTEAGKARNRRVEFRITVTPDEAEALRRRLDEPTP